MTNDFDSIKDSDVILVIGSNAAEAHPAAVSLIRKRIRSGDDKATLIVCDPCRTELADEADFYLQQKTGTDVALINSMMNVIIREELYNEEFVESNTESFNELKELVEQYSPRKVEQITGAPREVIIDAACTYANGKKCAIFYTVGITKDTDNVKALTDLALLCGMSGRSIYPLQ
jgi:anaerobic selenocysteine-containing dehydrogenase